MITTVNFHLIKACNFKCKFCYATFNDIHSKGLNKNEQKQLIKMLAEAKLFRKINFAGGEPTLVPHICELIRYSKELDFETSIVTNASRIDANWVENIAPYLDILAISVDSIINESNIESGRHENQETVHTEKLVQIAKACHKFGVMLKINTVVSQFNYQETLTNFINELKPFRWKILQVTRVEGQNDDQFDLVKITSENFEAFCKRNKQEILPYIKVVEESEEMIQGSYLMIDQLGRFFDDSNKIHNYSQPILQVGVHEALKMVSVDTTKFEQRQGNYTVISNKKAI